MESKDELSAFELLEEEEDDSGEDHDPSEIEIYSEPEIEEANTIGKNNK